METIFSLDIETLSIHRDRLHQELKAWNGFTATSQEDYDYARERIAYLTSTIQKINDFITRLEVMPESVLTTLRVTLTHRVASQAFYAAYQVMRVTLGDDCLSVLSNNPSAMSSRERKPESIISDGLYAIGTIIHLLTMYTICFDEKGVCVNEHMTERLMNDLHEYVEALRPVHRAYVDRSMRKRE